MYDCQSRSVTMLEEFSPRQFFLKMYLPYFDQFSQGFTPWAPDSRSFAYVSADSAFVQEVRMNPQVLRSLRCALEQQRTGQQSSHQPHMHQNCLHGPYIAVSNVQTVLQRSPGVDAESSEPVGT